LQAQAFEGAASAHFIQGGKRRAAGTSMFASEGGKLAAASKFQALRYPGEIFPPMDLHLETSSFVTGG